LDIISHRLSSQEEIRPKIFGRNLLVPGDLRDWTVFHKSGGDRKNPVFSLRISL
jgi:hypothetical protein